MNKKGLNNRISMNYFFQLFEIFKLPISAALAPVGPRISTRGRYGPALLNKDAEGGQASPRLLEL